MRFMGYCLETTRSGIVESLLIRPVVYPAGKPMMRHLPRCQEFGIAYYSLTLNALHLLHPRLLQR